MRRRAAKPRTIMPDMRFNDEGVTQFINSLMRQGKKQTAQRIFYKALELMESREGSDPYQDYLRAVENVQPEKVVRSRRVGGANYQVPSEVSKSRSFFLSRKWIIQAARKRGEKTMVERLANELLEASKKKGEAFKTRENMHRMADANKAHSHYRW